MAAESSQSSGVRESSPATKRGLASIGPAFITAALVFGPGSVTTNSSLGATFAYDLLWVPVIGTILMLCFVDIGVRIGLSTDSGPIATVANKMGLVVGLLVALGSVLVVSSFQAGNSVGTGAAVNVLYNGDTKVWAAVFTLLAITFLWLPGYYRRLETLMVAILGIMLVAFVVTAIVAQPDLGATLSGLIPKVPSGSQALIVGAAATTFSVVGALYQIQLVRQKGWGPDDYQLARRDAILGTLVLGLLSFVIMLAAAAVLHPQGVQVKSPADMANILTPTVGRWASVLFALGLWAAAFSSIVGNSTIGGTMLAALFGKEQGGVNARFTKICITAVMLVGGFVAVIFGPIPVQLILTAQAVTIFVVPLIGVVMVLLARGAERGPLRIATWQTVLGAIGIGFLLWLAYTYAVRLLGL